MRPLRPFCSALHGPPGPSSRRRSPGAILPPTASASVQPGVQPGGAGRDVAVGYSIGFGVRISLMAGGKRSDCCLNCACDIVQPSGPGRPRMFCGATCRKTYWRRMMRVRVIEMRRCRDCGEPFAIHEGRRGRPWTRCPLCRPKKGKKNI